MPKGVTICHLPPLRSPHRQSHGSPAPPLPQNAPVPAVEQPEPSSAPSLSKPSPPSDSVGTRRALLIAVEPWPDLEKDPQRGPGWQNLRKMREILKQKWNFEESHISQMYEKEATTERILEAFEQLITQTDVRDSVVIYTSCSWQEIWKRRRFLKS